MSIVVNIDLIYGQAFVIDLDMRNIHPASPGLDLQCCYSLSEFFQKFNVPIVAGITKLIYEPGIGMFVALEENGKVNAYVDPQHHISLRWIDDNIGAITSDAINRRFDEVDGAILP